MGEFLQLNGIAIPVLVDGADASPDLVMDSARAENQSLIENVEAEKLSLRLKLQPQTRANGFAHRGLIHGAGHYWSFDSHLYSSKGLGPTTATGASISAGAAWRGGFGLRLATGASAITFAALPARPLGSDGWTIMFRGNALPGAHVVITDMSFANEEAWLNGVYGGAVLSSIVAVDVVTGIVTLSTDTGTQQDFDELVILPYRVPDAWPPQMYAWQNPAGAINRPWSNLRQLWVRGEVIPEGIDKIMTGRVTGEKIRQYENLGGVAEQAARELEFQLTEV